MKNRDNQYGYRRHLSLLAAAQLEMIRLFERLLEDRFVVEIVEKDELYYQSLCALAESMLSKPGLEHLKHDHVVPYETIRTQDFCENGSIEWENGGRQNMQEFLAKIEEAVRDAGGPVKLALHTVGAETKRALEGNEPIFTATFSMGAQVMINDWTLSQPHYGGKNQIFFDYIIENPNRKITVKELKEKAWQEQTFEKAETAKKPEAIITDLGFKGVLKHLFFPHISISAVYFRNPVHAKDLESQGVSKREVEQFLQKTAGKRKK